MEWLGDAAVVSIINSARNGMFLIYLDSCKVGKADMNGYEALPVYIRFAKKMVMIRKEESFFDD
jgi:hypothetical protein